MLNFFKHSVQGVAWHPVAYYVTDGEKTTSIRFWKADPQKIDIHVHTGGVNCAYPEHLKEISLEEFMTETKGVHNKVYWFFSEAHAMINGMNFNVPQEEREVLK